MTEAGGYTNLEYRLDTGTAGRATSTAARCSRSRAAPRPGIVVNNNAAAVLLVLGDVARDREVIVSRGELVEIGGGFRVPEIMAETGCRLVEVGTTNRTRRADYERAVSERHRARAQGARVELPDGRVHRGDAGRRARDARAAGDGRRRDRGCSTRRTPWLAGPAGVAAATSPASASASTPAPRS